MSSAPLHDPTKGFHDLKPLLGTHSVDLSLLPLLIVPLLLLLLWVRRRSRKPGPVSKPKDYLRELESLCREARTENRSIRELASELSLLVRGFLDERVGIPAVERTRKELVRELQNASTLTEPEKELIHEILRECELLTYSPNAGSELLPVADRAQSLFVRRSA